MNRLRQARRFPGGQFPPRPLLDAFQAERADTDPRQSFDRDLDGLHHPSDDVVHPDVQADRQPDAFPRLAQQAKLVRLNDLAIDQDTVPHSLHRPVVRPDGGQDVIFLGQAKSGVHDPVRQFAVVGQDQQALGVAVQAADRVDALPDIDEIHHGPPVPLVTDRGDVSRRLVEDDRPVPLRPDLLAIDPNHGPDGVDPRPQLGDALAIDGDAALDDQRLGVATRTAASRGHHAL